ncbi:hypothetical protein [Streptomyces longwoodensis]|uniref:hypothetical protein n=1 Tax=Streptomyces longwoodensis TaxID=68231 RepID=UPI0036F67EAD
MDNKFSPPDPVQVRDEVLAREAELRALERDLHPGAHYEARCLLREAADKLIEAGRCLAAELPGRPPARPASRPVLYLAN